MSHDKLTEAAVKLGTQDGERLAESLVSLKMTKPLANLLLTGYEKQDPDIMALCLEPLEGTHGDQPSAMFILDEIAQLADDLQVIKYDEEENVLEAYENSYKEAFWAKVVARLKEIVNATQS